MAMEYLKSGLVGLSILFFLFQVFCQLRDDYLEKDIVRASVIGGLISGLFWWSAKKYELGLIPILLGVLLTIYFFSRYYSWRFWATLEQIAVAGVISLIIAYAYGVDVIPCLLTLATNLFWRNYRRFSWYPSGKAGFLFLANLASLSLFNSILDFWQGRLIKLVGQAIVFILCLISLILLSDKRKEAKTEVINLREGR